MSEKIKLYTKYDLIKMTGKMFGMREIKKAAKYIGNGFFRTKGIYQLNDNLLAWFNNDGIRSEQRPNGLTVIIIGNGGEIYWYTDKRKKGIGIFFRLKYSNEGIRLEPYIYSSHFKVFKDTSTDFHICRSLLAYLSQYYPRHIENKSLPLWQKILNVENNPGYILVKWKELGFLDGIVAISDLFSLIAKGDYRPILYDLSFFFYHKEEFHYIRQEQMLSLSEQWKDILEKCKEKIVFDLGALQTGK